MWICGWMRRVYPQGAPLPARFRAGLRSRLQVICKCSEGNTSEEQVSGSPRRLFPRGKSFGKTDSQGSAKRVGSDGFSSAGRMLRPSACLRPFFTEPGLQVSGSASPGAGGRPRRRGGGNAEPAPAILSISGEASRPIRRIRRGLSPRCGTCFIQETKGLRKRGRREIRPGRRFGYCLQAREKGPRGAALSTAFRSANSHIH